MAEMKTFTEEERKTILTKHDRQGPPLASPAKAGCGGGCNCNTKTDAQDQWRDICSDALSFQKIDAKEGRKDDSYKLRYDLVPPGALAQITDVLTFGANKYADENWRKVADPERRYIAAAMRHIEAYRAGDITDPESGRHHLAHAACCLMFILEA